MLFPELLGAILKQHGVDKTTSQYCEMAMMASHFIGAMAAVMKGAQAPGTSSFKSGRELQGKP